MQRKSIDMYEFWFLVGSQFLYGPETLNEVASHAQQMVEGLNASGKLPCKVVYKATLKTPEEIEQCIKDANYDDTCAGIITWMHTFSPSKMWIN
ncbi:MAG: L-arabinose isomerase, partial [Sphaerochaeta sp.]|nr:L-arabinose isomerase [Sphaerochaeta sp.]